MRTALATVFLTGAIAAALPVGAATQNHWMQANGSGVCQAALPNFEGQIRKRPLAIQNEGTANAFVTCSPTSLQYAEASSGGHGVFFKNDSDAGVTIGCTGVMGASDWSTEYSPRSVTIAANDTGAIYWEPTDFPTNGSSSQTTFNVSCTLAPGVGLRTVYINQLIEIGN